MSFHTQACDSTYANVYAARLDRYGTVLDADGLPVCTAEGEQKKTRLAAGDDQALILWEDDRNYANTAYDIYGARVALDGTVLDPGGMSIAQIDRFEEAPDICWTGETFLAIWQSSYYGLEGDVFGTRVDTLGALLDSVPQLLSSACDAQLSGSSAWGGQFYLTIWDGGGDLQGTRVDHFGNILDSTGIDVSSVPESQAAPDVVWGGQNLFAVWEDSRAGKPDIYGARIDSLGQVLDTLGLPISLDPATDKRLPAIAHDGGNYLVVWQQMLDSTGSYYRVEGIRISADGVPIGPQSFSISSGDKAGNPDLAFGGGNYLVVWQDNQFYDIYGALVDTIGTIKSQFGIRTGSGLQEDPAVASDGQGFLVVWEDFGSHWPNADVLAARVTSTGVVLDPGGIEVSAAADAELMPSVTFDGSNYVVAWKREVDVGGQVYVGRVSPEGAVLDPAGILIADVSAYSLTSLASGPVSCGLSDTVGQSLLLYSRYQGQPFNSPRMFGALFWGQPEPNYPPQSFSLLLPVDQDTVMKPVDLDWEDAVDPNSGDQVIYSVYLSYSESFHPDSTQVTDGLTSSDFQVSPERDSITYWWKVKGQDRWGEEVWSNEIFSFDLESYGDVNSDGTIDLGDAVFLMNYLFKGGPWPEPLAAGDVNGDCEVDVGDVVYLLNYLFKGGSSPVAGCA